MSFPFPPLKPIEELRVGFYLAALYVRYRVRAQFFSVFLLVIAIALSVAVLRAVIEASTRSIESFSALVPATQGDLLFVRHRRGHLTRNDVRGWYPKLSQTVPSLSLLRVEGYVSRPNSSELVSILGAELGGRSLRAAQEPLPLVLPHEALLSAKNATKWGVREGEIFSLTVLDEEITFTARITSEESESLSGSDEIVVSLSRLQAAPALRGRVSEIMLLAPARAGDIMRQALEPTLTSVDRGLFVVSRKDEHERLARLTGAFRTNIEMLGLLTLGVIAFTLFNASRLSILSELSQFSILKTLGVSRRMIYFLALSEVAAIAVMGTAVGLTAARPITSGAYLLLSNTVQEIYKANYAPGEFSTLALLIVIVFGVGAPLLGAVIPARSAARVPAGLANRAPLDPRPLGVIRLTVFALACAGMAVGSLLLSMFFMHHLSAHLGAIFLLCVGGFAAPAFALTVIRMVRPLLLRIGPAGFLAYSQSVAGMRMAALSIGVTACGIALLIGLSVMIGSFRSSLYEWLEHTLEADIFVRVEQSSAGFREIPEAVLVSIEHTVTTLTPQASIRRLRTVDQIILSKPATVFGTELPAALNRGVYRLVDRPPRTQHVLCDSMEPLTAIVNESAARHLNVKRGDILPLAQKHLMVCGIYRDYASEQPSVVLDEKLFREIFPDIGVTSLSVTMAPAEEVTPDQLQNVVRQIRERGEGLLFVGTQGELRTSALEVFTKTFAITDILRLVVIVLCSAGFSVMLLQVAWERRRDLRVMSIIGVSRHQHIFAGLLEGLLLLVPGLIAGTLAGLALGYALVVVINPVFFGWTLTFSVSLAEFIKPFFAMLLCTILPALFTSYIAVKKSASAATSSE